MLKSGMTNGNVTHGHLGNLAPPCQAEESASHHVLITLSHMSFNTVRQHKIFASEVVIRSAETSSRGQIS